MIPCFLKIGCILQAMNEYDNDQCLETPYRIAMCYGKPSVSIFVIPIPISQTGTRSRLNPHIARPALCIPFRVAIETFHNPPLTPSGQS